MKSMIVGMALSPFSCAEVVDLFTCATIFGFNDRLPILTEVLES
jgi:hypothetical protein